MTTQKPKRTRITLTSSDGKPFKPVTRDDLMKAGLKALEQRMHLDQLLHDLEAARRLWREFPEVVESDDEKVMDAVRAERDKARDTHVKAMERARTWKNRKAAS